MKKEDIKKLRELTIDELKGSIGDSQKELYKFKHDLNVGQLKNYSLVNNTRKRIAVLQTILAEKLEAGKSKT